MSRAFTLIELLVVVAIIAVVLSLLLPAVRSTVQSSRSFKCQSALRSVAFDFQVFADDRLHGSRQNDDEDIPGYFRAETFQNSAYGLDRFWPHGTQLQATYPDANGRDPMRCPEVKGDVTVSRNLPCTAGAINPPERISFTFNFRLHRPATGGIPMRLSGRILEDGQTSRIPLMWDVDGAEATRRGVLPVFSAPGLGATTGILANDRYWFPSFRHAGACNFAFVDGHVEFTPSPLSRADWAWSYQPR